MRKLTSLFGLLLLAVPFHGESCTKVRNPDAVITATITSDWTTRGFTQGSSSDTKVVNRADDIKDALDDLNADDIESMKVSGVCYKVVANRGSAARQAATHSGSVKIDGTDLLTFSSPDTRAGTTGGTGDGRVVLKPAGVTYINSKLAQYLASYEAGTPNQSLLNGITFAATWQSNPNATASDRDDFDWQVCVVIQVVAKVEVDVFEP